MYIGGLIVKALKCNCNAPFIESGLGEDGKVYIAIHDIFNEEGENRTIFTTMLPDESMDCLEMLCTRCGKSAI
jgi:hypothetical protein